MSAALESTDTSLDKEDPSRFVLRGKPRPVVRFRRGVVVGATGVVAAVLVTLSWFALEPRTFRKAPASGESEPLPRSAPPDVLAGAPKDYADVPRLGPPLPGDLGRPILEHERELALPKNERFGGAEDRHVWVAEQRGREAAITIAARSSPILVELRQPEIQGHSAAADTLPPPLPKFSDPPPDLARTSTMRQEKLAFASSAGGDVNRGQLLPPVAPFMLVAGTIIPATLVTGLNSDNPGIVLAQVTENVRDSTSGTTILVPQGARLIGRYDSVVAFGQKRALVVWNRIIFPNGTSIDLDNVPATDSSGYAGLSDGVDAHTWQLLKGIGLSTLLGVGTESSLQSSGSDLVRAIRESAQQSAMNSGAQIVSRDLDIQPTITIRPGWPVRAILNKDLVLQPWTS